MENYKIKSKIIAPNFGKHPKLALKLLEDEKKAREAMRKKYRDNEEIVLPKYVQDIMDEVA